MPEVRKFTFDTVFDTEGAVLHAPVRPKRSYTPDEVEAERTRAFAEGEASAASRAHEAAAASLAAIADTAQALISTLNAEALRLREDAVQLGMVAARTAAGYALAQYEDEEIVGFFRECAEDLRSEPRIEVAVGAVETERVRQRLTEAAQAAQLDAALIVNDDGPETGCAITWSAGGVTRSSEDALARIEDAAQRWLSGEAERAEQMDLFSGPFAADGATQ